MKRFFSIFFTICAFFLIFSDSKAQFATFGQNPKNTITGPVTFVDDVELRFGTGNTLACEWSTTDANANEFVCSGPEGGAVDVPVFVFGDATCNALDIGLFNGLTNGTVVAMNDACTGGTYFSHDGTDGTMVTTTGDLLLNISGANLAPSANDGSALGISGTAWADLFLASGAVINFSAADVTATHSANTLTFAGASSGYLFDANVSSSVAGNPLTLTNSTDGASVQTSILQGDRATMADSDEAYMTLRLSDDAGTQTEFARLTWVATDVNAGTSVDGELQFSVVTAGSLAKELNLSGAALYPQTTDGLSLGISGTEFSDLFLDSGAVINFDGGDVTATHSSNTLAFAGASSGYTFDNIVSMSAGTLRYSTTASITASTTQTQGQQALTTTVNEVSVCANTNDTVTLPAAVAGLVVYIFNNGAQTLQVFPASGDAIDDGAANASKTQASGVNITYIAHDATTWNRIHSPL